MAMACRAALAVAVAALLCVQCGAASAGDFDVFRCPLGDGQVEYHCRGKDAGSANGLVRGVTAGGLGFFEGVLDGAQARVSWWNVSLAAGNPDRMQVASGAAVISYADGGSATTATWVRWVGGDAPVGDRVEDTYAALPPRTCEMEPVVDQVLFERACLSSAESAASSLMFSLDQTVMRGSAADEEVSVCHRGRSTISYFSALLSAEECRGLAQETANYTGDARISCEQGRTFEGYFLTPSTLRFRGTGSLGVIGTWGGTGGVLKGFQGTGLLVVSGGQPPYDARGTLRVLDAHAGGLLQGDIAIRYKVDSAPSEPRVCDAAKTRSFELIPRYCHPDDKVDYVSPWAPQEGGAARVSTTTAAGEADIVLMCSRPVPTILGYGVGHVDEYHCIKDKDVSGSYSSFGFFQGHFDNQSLTAHVNFLQVGGGAKGVMPESGAAVWTYAVGFSGVASASAWWTGSSAASRLSEPQWAGSGYSCQMLDGDAKKEAERSRCLAPQQDAVDANWAGTCSDVAGFRDSEGRTCDEWADHPSWCIGSPEDGVYDPPSVYRNRGGIDASQACCVCKQSNLPLTGTTWHRDASGHEPAGQTMGEVHFCNQVLPPHPLPAPLQLAHVTSVDPQARGCALNPAPAAGSSPCAPRRGRPPPRGAGVETSRCGDLPVALPGQELADASGRSRRRPLCTRHPSHCSTHSVSRACAHLRALARRQRLLGHTLQGLNALAAHSFRQLHPDCTPRMIQEKVSVFRV